MGDVYKLSNSKRTNEMKVFSRNFRDALSSRWSVKIQDGLDYHLAPEPAGVARQGGVEWEYPAHIRLTAIDRRLVTVLDLESAARLRDDLDRVIWEAQSLAEVVVGRTYSSATAPVTQALSLS
jgi:hypothetical protein